MKLLPVEVSGVSYGNVHAALSFRQNVSQYLHERLIGKIKEVALSVCIQIFSPGKIVSLLFCLVWMMDESTLRTTQKKFNRVRKILRKF